MSSKVYITQETHRLNFTDAERFGEVVFMSVGETSPMKSSIRNKAIVSDIKRMAAQFDHKQDYLLLSGDPVITAIAFHEIMARTPDKAVMLLKWDNQSKSYNDIVVAL